MRRDKRRGETMQQSETKVKNDFMELIAALDAEEKKMKNSEHKAFIKQIRANVALWSVKYDAFIAYQKAH